VTDRGRAVARLVPIHADAWDDLVAAGKVTPATDEADVADEVPGDYAVDASAVLAAMRAGER
jgi:antitoxin (DNA-binding transcriptional repressor) of toxin-antitoxin stability system